MTIHLSDDVVQSEKIQHITFFLPTLAGGGAEKVFVDLANEYIDHGHKVTMVCALAEGSFRTALHAHIEVVDLGAKRILLSVLPLWRFLKTHKTDVIVSAMLHANIGLLIATRVFGRYPSRVVVQDVAPLSRMVGRRMSFLRLMMKRLYPLADVCLAISDKIADEINEAVGWIAQTSRVVVLPNPVVLRNVTNLEAVKPSHPWIENKDGPIILAVGRLSVEKDFPTLLRAVATARKETPLKLIIIGEGGERRHLEDLSKSLGIDDIVSMPGFVQNPYGYMAHADVVAVSSLFEGFSLVILEALATGTSLVITDCGDGPMSIVEWGKFADVVQIGDQNAMAQAILHRIDNPFAPDALKARARTYDIEPLSKLYLEVFLRTKIGHTSQGRHVCFYVPNLAGGGAERLVVDLANFNVTQAGRSTIVCGEAIGPYLPNVSPDVSIIDLGHSRVFSSVFALKKIIYDHRPDVIIANMSHANVVLLLAALFPPRFKGCVVVQEVAQVFAGRSALNPIRDKVVLLFMKWLYPYADRVIAISSSISDELHELMKHNHQKDLQIEVLPGLIDYDTIRVQKDAPVRLDWFEDPNIKVVIAIGRLSGEKDFKTLIAAFAEVRKRQNVRLIILGEGALRQDLHSQCVQLGLEKDVLMPGFVENPFSYLSRSDVFVLSSVAEGFGLVVAEALACGCNVVVTKCSQGPIDIVSEGRFGALIEMSDSSAMAEAIIEKIENPIASDVLQARGKEFGIETVGHKYLDVMLAKKCEHPKC